jgi:hypothetical protein
MMPSTFFTDLLPSLTGAAAQVGPAGYQGAVQGKQLAQQMALQEAQLEHQKAISEWYKSGGKQSPQLQALNLLASTNPDAYAQILSNPKLFMQYFGHVGSQPKPYVSVGAGGLFDVETGQVIQPSPAEKPLVVPQGSTVLPPKAPERSGTTPYTAPITKPTIVPEGATVLPPGATQLQPSTRPFKNPRTKVPTLVESKIAEYDRLTEGQKQAWRQRNPMTWRLIEAEIKKRERTGESAVTVRPPGMIGGVGATFKGKDRERFLRAYGDAQAFIQKEGLDVAKGIMNNLPPNLAIERMAFAQALQEAGK